MTGPFGRVPATSPTVMRRLAIAALLAQAGIAVTGSVVRVTGSGLGCPTWPECFPGSLVPVSNADVAPLHQWIEFGNRLLGIVLVLVAGACLLAALNTRPRRRRLTLLAAAMPAGVVAQAVVGGVTVLAGLVWWTVAPHFLVSMVLVWLAVLLVVEAGGPAADPGRQPPVAPVVRRLVTAGIAVLGALLVAGTLVTAAGPHAGDADTPRLEVSVSLLAQIHGGLVLAYLGLLVAVGVALRATGAPATVWRRYGLLVGVVLAQGVLGRVQYALGVPELLVSLHVLGACLVTAAAAALWSTTGRRPMPPAQLRTEGNTYARGAGPADRRPGGPRARRDARAQAR